MVTICGIGGVTRLTDRPFPKMDEFCSMLLDGIEYRGTDATGYIAITDNGDVQMQKASCSAFHFNKHRAKIDGSARTVLLHTRFATQGKAAFPENNHPVNCGPIWAVHNGHIWNDDAVAEISKYPRMGEVDSWAIPALVAERGWEDAPGCFRELDGDMATALINVNHPRDVILARGNSNPLIVLKTKHLLVWASSSQAIKEAWAKILGTPPKWNKFDFLQDGESIVVSEGNVEEVRFTPGLSWTYSGSGSYSKWSWDDDKYDWGKDDWKKDYDTEILEDGTVMYVPKNRQNLGSSDESETGTDMELYGHRSVDLDEIAGKIVDNWELDGIPMGIDTMRCEDCGEWFPEDEIFVTHIYGIKSDLCKLCMEYAREEMMITE